MPFAFSLGAEKKGISFWRFRFPCLRRMVQSVRRMPAGDDRLRAGLRQPSVAIPSLMIKIQSDEWLDT